MALDAPFSSDIEREIFETTSLIYLDHGTFLRFSSWFAGSISAHVDFGASRHFTAPSLLHVLTHLPVHRLSLSLGALFGGPEYVNPTHVVFRCVTHIDVFDMMDEGLLEIVAHVPQLPALTHLCLDDHTPLHILTSLLVDCPRLALLLVLCPLFQTRVCPRRAS
ncbi:hypothetical protein DFH06DRAFT_1326882 [Mycena polygramma]|nr:hypothetical protein DFH06DRAFT_1326882 [Mycena polygramma]